MNGVERILEYIDLKDKEASWIETKPAE